MTGLRALTLSAAIASAASADITVTLTNQTFTGFNFLPVVDYTQSSIVGTLTGASISVTLDASVAYTYADDLCVYVDIEPLSTAGFLQIGGFSNLSAAQRYSWPNGASNAPGTTSIGTVNLTTALSFTGNKAVDGTVWVGNGYGATGTSGTWTGTVTLHGVTAIPICSVIDWYLDADGDGFGGSVAPPVQSCVPVPNRVANALDCDDSNAAINPNTTWYRDTDGDGVGAAVNGTLVQCTQPAGYVLAAGDNCPNIANTNQADINNNGLGDACELARGDLNLDGVVNASDLAPFFNAWGSVGPLGDLNFDGLVNSADFTILLGNWGTTP